MKRTALEAWIQETESLPRWNREALEALQLQRLNHLLARAKARGGIYRDYPAKLSSLEQLQALPFTTAEDLSGGKLLLTSQSQVSRVISGATSGTTGPAKRVFYTQADLAHTVGFFAAGISEMLAPGDRCLIAFPFSGPFGLGDLIAKAVERLGGIPIPAGSRRSWGALSDLVRAARPAAYIGFPVTLLSLARYYGAGFPIRKALVSGDACPPGVMDALEAQLDSRLYPHYGSRECGLGGAVTCPAFEGMHLRENHILAEIVDEKGNVLPTGAYGELVITTIGMEAMPLIRYRTGDFTRFLPPCPCGGITRRIDRVSRRAAGLSVEDLDSALFPIPGLLDYRASLTDALELFALVLEDGLEASLGQAAARCCPGYPIRVKTARILPDDGPLYPGKRFLLNTPLVP